MTEPERRAARFWALPGVTRAEATARYGVSARGLTAARKALGAQAFPSPAEILLCALTRAGCVRAGTVGDPSSLAGFVDYVNHDGTTVAEIPGLLAVLVADGLLRVDGDRFELLRDWP